MTLVSKAMLGGRNSVERSSQYDVSKAVADAPRCGAGGSRWVGGDLLLGIHDGGCVLCVIMVWMVEVSQRREVRCGVVWLRRWSVGLSRLASLS
jgi:hypothetical protein